MIKSGLYKILHGRPVWRRRWQPLNIIEISSARLLANFNLIQDQHKDFGVMPVLKANAYGHGLVEVATILNAANCRFLVVDAYFEAAQILAYTKHPILILGPVRLENLKLINTKRFSFVAQDIAALEALAKLNKPLKIHLELNTGMNRLGLDVSELGQYLKKLKKYPKLKLEGVMTHLADADNPRDNSFTNSQTKLFDAQVANILKAGFKPEIIHVANSAGSAKIKSKYANGLRLGISLYGINPLEPSDKSYQKLAALAPALELKSTIIKVVNLKAGDTVSYGRTFIARKPMRIGVLPLGYYEGLPRALSNRGCVTFGGETLPIVGRVCMNHTMIDLKKSKLEVGASVTVISADKSSPNSVQSIANNHDLFSYSLLTGLASSVRREIV